MHPQEVNGIISQAKVAKAKSAHAQVFEQMQIEEIMCAKSSTSLIEYLQSKQIIGNEIGEETGQYQINIPNLLEQEIEYGKGQATESTKKDVYILEEQEETNSNGEIVYQVKYYGNKAGEEVPLGTIGDNEERTISDLEKLKFYFERRNLLDIIEMNEDEITFKTIPGAPQNKMPDINQIVVYDNISIDDNNDIAIIKYYGNYYNVTFNANTYSVSNVEVHTREYKIIGSGDFDNKSSVRFTLKDYTLGNDITMDIKEEYSPKMIVDGETIDLTPCIQFAYDYYIINLNTGLLDDYNNKTATITLNVNGKEVSWTGIIETYHK